MNIADRLRSALLRPAPGGLLRGDLAKAQDSSGKLAAVLIAVTDRPEPGVIFTVRRDDMRTHAGQIAFPGGRLDSGEDAVSAALREAWEELGLEPALVEVVAPLEPYHTITGYEVTPVVGVVPPDLPLAPHEHEVAEWFEAPLAFVLNPTNCRRQTAVFDGGRRHYYQVEWKGRKIWGATAAMLVNLSRRLQWS